MSSDVIRGRTLKFLYEEAKQHPYGVHRSAVMEALGTAEAAMDRTMTFLARRNLVKLTRTPSVFWIRARITYAGKAAIENPARYSTQFPFLKYLEE